MKIMKQLILIECWLEQIWRWLIECWLEQIWRWLIVIL